MLRPLWIAVLVLTAAVPPAVAGTAPLPLRAELADCETGTTRAERRARFVATMPGRPGADELRLRFTLQRAAPGGWRSLPAPGFGRWEHTRRAAGGFRFEQAVDGLWAPGRFRVRVHFQWRADGVTLARARRASAECRQPDLRADLRVAAITAVAGPDGTAAYAVTVRNAGRGDAEGPFDVVLGLQGRNLPAAGVARLAAGASTTVRIDGPACRSGDVVRATADAGRVVDQPRRSDDALDVPCPLHSVGS